MDGTCWPAFPPWFAPAGVAFLADFFPLAMLETLNPCEGEEAIGKNKRIESRKLANDLLTTK